MGANAYTLPQANVTEFWLDFLKTWLQGWIMDSERFCQPKPHKSQKKSFPFQITSNLLNFSILGTDFPWNKADFAKSAKQANRSSWQFSHWSPFQLDRHRLLFCGEHCLCLLRRKVVQSVISTFKTERPPPSDEIWPKTRGGRSEPGGGHFGSCVTKRSLLRHMHPLRPPASFLTPHPPISNRPPCSENLGSRKQGGSFRKGEGGRSVLNVLICSPASRSESRVTIVLSVHF